MEHLVSRRCPECGREFDPRDAASFRVPQSLRWRVAGFWSKAVRSEAVAFRPEQSEPLLAWAVSMCVFTFVEVVFALPV